MVDGDGTPVGLVDEAAVRSVRRRTPALGPGRRPSRRLEPALTLLAELAGEELVEASRPARPREYLVVEANGDVYGVLATADVERALART